MQGSDAMVMVLLPSDQAALSTVQLAVEVVGDLLQPVGLVETVRVQPLQPAVQPQPHAALHMDARKLSEAGSQACDVKGIMMPANMAGRSANDALVGRVCFYRPCQQCLHVRWMGHSQIGFLHHSS